MVGRAGKSKGEYPEGSRAITSSKINAESKGPEPESIPVYGHLNRLTVRSFSSSADNVAYAYGLGRYPAVNFVYAS